MKGVNVPPTSVMTIVVNRDKTGSPLESRVANVAMRDKTGSPLGNSLIAGLRRLRGRHG